MNAQFENIHLLICTSKRVPPLEMAVPMVDDLVVLQDGVEMFDAYLNREVLVLAPVIACVCDTQGLLDWLVIFGEIQMYFVANVL